MPEGPNEFYSKNKSALLWALISLPFGMGVAYFIIFFMPLIISLFYPPILSFYSLPGVSEILVSLGLLIFGSIIAWFLGNWLDKALAKIHDEKKMRLAKISLAICLLFMGLISLILIYSPFLAAYGLI